MADSTIYLKSLPGRYAKALFDAAPKDLDQIIQSFDVLETLTTSFPQLTRLLNAHILKKEDTLTLWKTLGERFAFPKSFIYFLCLLSSSKRLHITPQIRIYFQKLYNSKNNIQHVVVTSASPLTKEIKSSFEELLKEKLKKQLDIKYEEDEKLLWGFTVRTDQSIIDASAKTFLNQLSKRLREA